MSERLDRLERLIERALNDLIPTLKDPRIPIIVTIERIRLASDMSNAKILVSTLSDDDDEIEDMLDALNRAAGYLQRELAEDLQTRRTPRLSFHADVLEVL